MPEFLGVELPVPDDSSWDQRYPANVCAAKLNEVRGEHVAAVTLLNAMAAGRKRCAIAKAGALCVLQFEYSMEEARRAGTAYDAAMMQHLKDAVAAITKGAKDACEGKSITLTKEENAAWNAVAKAAIRKMWPSQF